MGIRRLLVLVAAFTLSIVETTRAQNAAASCEQASGVGELDADRATTLAWRCGAAGRAAVVAHYKSGRTRSGREEAALAMALIPVRAAEVFEVATERLADRTLSRPARMAAVFLLLGQWDMSIGIQRHEADVIESGRMEECRGGVRNSGEYRVRSPLPSDSTTRFNTALVAAASANEPDPVVRALASCAYRHSRGTMPPPTEKPRITVSSPCENTFEFHNPGKVGVEFNWWDTGRTIGGLEMVPAGGTLRRSEFRVTQVEIKVGGVVSGPYAHRAEKCRR